MNPNMRGSLLLTSLAVGLLFGGPSGCGATSPVSTQQPFGKAAAKAPRARLGSADSENPRINLQCDAERIRNAPAPFHWSYKKTMPPLTNVDWEADVTPSSIAGAVTDGSGTRVIHGVRSDPTSWNTVVAILTSALPGSTFSLVNNSSAITREGNESVNGQRTTRYNVDTSRDTPADASLIRSVLGPSGSIKGAAWVNAQGCPVKFVLDVEQHYADRTAHREHYEANVTQQ
jgi:hypothetical protein